MAINVTFWYEAKQEIECGDYVKKAYPEGMAKQMENIFAGQKDIHFRAVTFYDKDFGLPDSLLNETDVLIWWAHAIHDQVPDELAEKVQQRVLKGMGLIVLHSGHLSKPFVKLMGTSCTLRWRDDDRERLWCVNPAHPIAQGLPEYFELPVEEMYGEFFDIPEPDELVFVGWFAGGEVFRSGCAWHRGYGKVFYFQPGHESNPIYFNEYVQKILVNAAHWAAPTASRKELTAPNTAPLETSGK